IPADWGVLGKRLFAVDVQILANDREDLLRDVSDLISKARVHITAVSSVRKQGQVNMHLTLELADRAQLQHLLQQLSVLQEVIYARRR
ncbi:MAG: hypothetical protein RLZZ502_1487, partial [Pseudomonadota bacterium]